MEIWGYQTGVRVAGTPPRSRFRNLEARLAVQISNQNVTLATGSAVRDAKVLVRGAIRRRASKRAMYTLNY